MCGQHKEKTMGPHDDNDRNDAHDDELDEQIAYYQAYWKDKEGDDNEPV